MVVIDKIITSQIGMTDIISKLIIKTIYSVKMLWDVSIVERKAMLGMIVLYGRNLLKKRRIPNWKLE
jgi:hypothetical protein